MFKVLQLRIYKMLKDNISLIKMLLNVVEVICREPYRLFFPLGTWMGIVGVSPWLFYAFGFSHSYSGLFHSSIQMMVFMNCFVVGFLMTFIPRFTGTSVARRSEVFSFLFLFLGMSVFLRMEEWIKAELLYVVWFVLLLRFLLIRIPRRRSDPSAKPPIELVWIPAAVLHGILGTGLMIMARLGILPAGLLKMAKPMMEQGFILSIVIGIGSFLVARLMKTLVREEGKPNMLFQMACIAGFMTSFIIEGLGLYPAAYGLRALVTAAVFTRANILFRVPRAVDFYVVLAWVSVWMVVAGFAGAALFPLYSVAMLHIAFIGGFSLLIYAIATMVIMSHAGQRDQLSRRLWVLWVVAIGILLALTKRFVVIFFPDVFFKMLGIASIVWTITGVCWLLFILPRLFIVPSEDEFGRMHEQAKKQINR